MFAFIIGLYSPRRYSSDHTVWRKGFCNDGICGYNTPLTNFNSRHNGYLFTDKTPFPDPHGGGLQWCSLIRPAFFRIHFMLKNNHNLSPSSCTFLRKWTNLTKGNLEYLWPLWRTFEVLKFN